ncbi:acyl-CoA N-acyltransferase [Dissoconium aciculare CBS 342.82]|uniref:Acyl-CoA N-acyltransferase n=1 Tax=Dissoconium aciculare CBS 342.82 TaxID=1314786 RepID=A0A6J3LWI5_9PEZI|nr:acyl-CoA N-acyltransferase [Dissoconium aciculare CBS 342.82]KAF1820013.1 acyl-CoA N-acyltransferase [Dissoconium aciculare CBS 342.82]
MTTPELAIVCPSDSVPIKGRYVTLEAFREDHAPSLWTHFEPGPVSELFRYIPVPVAKNAKELEALMLSLPSKYGFVLYAIVGDPPARETLGVIGFLDIRPQYRALETGAVIFSPALQRTAAATEAHYLLLRHVLDKDPRSDHEPYSRVAYKCHTLNGKSRRAAERLGYVYEGTFRKHMVVDGRPRSSDWLSIIDDDWPLVKRALEGWLDENNFDADGRQLRTLENIRNSL